MCRMAVFVGCHLCLFCPKTVWQKIETFAANQGGATWRIPERYSASSQQYVGLCHTLSSHEGPCLDVTRIRPVFVSHAANSDYPFTQSNDPASRASGSGSV